MTGVPTSALSISTGTITVSLFDPTQTCGTGTARFSQAFGLTGVTGTADVVFTTTGGPTADKAGTWQWTASYPGDGNNNSASSACGSEPVSIAGVCDLSIDKTCAVVPPAAPYVCTKPITALTMEWAGPANGGFPTCVRI